MQYGASATIDAPVETVWEVLTDGSGYAAWDNGVVRVEGSITDGRKIKVFSEVSPERAFPVKVSLDAPTQMRWTGGMPLGLFTGVRTFHVGRVGEQTQVDIDETFSGPLLGMMAKQMPDLQPSFDHFARGLKTEAERRAAG